MTNILNFSEKILTSEETEELLTYANGSSEDKEFAFEKIMNSNAGLIRKIIFKYKQYVSPSFNEDDLFAVAMLGFVRAIQLFDPKKGYKFQTYAGSSMHYQIWRAIETEYIGLRLPIQAQRNQYKLSRLIETFFQKYHREPSIEELSRLDGFTKKQIAFLLSLPKVTCSLDDPLGDGFSVIGDIISDSNDPMNVIDDQIDSKDLWGKIRSLLTLKEIEVISMRYGFITDSNEELTFTEISKSINISRQRVNQIHDSAIAKLTKFITTTNKVDR